MVLKIMIYIGYIQGLTLGIKIHKDWKMKKSCSLKTVYFINKYIIMQGRLHIKMYQGSSVYVFFFFFFSGTGSWTHGLQLEPLHHPFFVKGFFQDRFLPRLGSNCDHPISASWVAKITGISHLHLAKISIYC
jgi:hypothetical protein